MRSPSTLAGDSATTPFKTVYAANLLPVGMSGVGRYEPITHTYYPPGSGLVKFPADLAQARAGVGGRKKIAFVGPSNVAGYNGTISLRGYGDYPTQFAAELEAAGYPVNEPVFTYCDAIAADNRGSLTGSWSYSAHPSSTVVVTGFAGATITQPCKRRGDTVEVALLRGVSATEATIAVDGVQITSGVTVVGGTFSGGAVFTSTGGGYCIATVAGLPYGVHTVTVGCVSAIVLGWVEAYTAAASISTANFGSSGTGTANWLDQSVPYTLLNTVIAWAPDVVIFNIGMQFNSWQNGEALATSLANMLAAAQVLISLGIEVFLDGLGPAISPVTGTPTPAFYQNAYALADALGVPMLEHFTAWGSSEPVALANGLIGGADTVHPSLAGYAAIAKALAVALGIVAYRAVAPWLTLSGTLSGVAGTPTLAAVSGFYKLDPTAGAFQVNLPTAPPDGTIIWLKQTSASSSNRIDVVAGGSDTIVGTPGNATALVSPGHMFGLEYFAASTSWAVLSSSHSLLTDGLSEPLWHPSDTNLIAANFDPATISAAAGGSLVAGDLFFMMVKVPANKAINFIWLDIFTAGATLTAGTSCLAAVYEINGNRSGVTADQATAWQSAGVKAMAVGPIAAVGYARKVWVAFIAAGTTLPKVGYNGGGNLGNNGLAGVGPQVAGLLSAETTCPSSISFAAMVPAFKYWVGLS